MKSVRDLAVVSICILVRCGGEAPPPAASPPAAASAGASAPAPTPAAAPSASAEPPPPAEPTPEEKKKAEALRTLQEERAKWQEGNTTELARWTPELHASAKALADKRYGSARAALRAATTGKHRKPGNADRDKARHPVETLTFFGFKPTLTVLEVSPGDGWYTELLAPALAAQGKLIATTTDPAGPEDQGSTFNG
jgi:hypothetical protein